MGDPNWQLEMLNRPLGEQWPVGQKQRLRGFSWGVPNTLAGGTNLESKFVKKNLSGNSSKFKFSKC